MNNDQWIDIFTIVWILSWFLGCWMYHTELFLTGLFSLILGLITASIESNKEREQKYCTNCGKKLITSGLGDRK